jgi:hypothetical protein
VLAAAESLDNLAGKQFEPFDPVALARRQEVGDCHAIGPLKG